MEFPQFWQTPWDTHALQKTGVDHGIGSTAICPGFVATYMSRGVSEVPPKRMTQPADLAHLVRIIIELPNSASVSELPVNWRAEDTV